MEFKSNFVTERMNQLLKERNWTVLQDDNFKLY